MTGEIKIEMMSDEFILWRCLHGGPLSSKTICCWPKDTEMPWERYRIRNTGLIERLTDSYGACAVVARHGEEIVGQLRFYPKAVWEMKGAGFLCLQQDYPAGPEDDFFSRRFPPVDELEDRTLKVHCLMTGSPKQKENPYQRRGIGTRMVKKLVEWAGDMGWSRIEVDAFEDLPIIYEVTGGAGLIFWEKLGFGVVDRFLHPDLTEYDDFIAIIEKQANEAGIDPAKAKESIVMCYELPDAGM